jgi:hypothetical protein
MFCSTESARDHQRHELNLCPLARICCLCRISVQEEPSKHLGQHDTTQKLKTLSDGH